MVGTNIITFSVCGHSQYLICAHKIRGKLHKRLRLIIMHQSFVTTAPMGPGNSGAFDFSLCKARVYAQHCRDIFMV